jgi:hypothetical protein
MYRPREMKVWIHSFIGFFFRHIVNVVSSMFDRRCSENNSLDSTIVAQGLAIGIQYPYYILICFPGFLAMYNSKTFFLPIQTIQGTFTQNNGAQSVAVNTKQDEKDNKAHNAQHSAHTPNKQKK